MRACSVIQSCLTLCDPMNCSMPGIPVHHQLPEPTQTHVHCVGDAIQPFHPLSSPSPAFNLSQHQGLFKWVSASQQVAKVLEFQHQSFQYSGLISFRMDWLCFTSIQNQVRGTKLLKGNCLLFLVLLNWWGRYLWRTVQDIKCTFQVSVSQSVQSLSRVQLSVTPMDCSTPGLPVHHQLPELAQTHVH